MDMDWNTKALMLFKLFNIVMSVEGVIWVWDVNIKSVRMLPHGGGLVLNDCNKDSLEMNLLKMTGFTETQWKISNAY